MRYHTRVDYKGYQDQPSMSMQDLTHSDTVSGSPSLDVAVATRFISSLSKSLQALCHGCMDFDTGIEIVGFINVNIDNGNKADYVLNEKVSKCANNSMTFVSNSFLAKKEQPKQTRDGACSPVQELMIPVHSSSHNGYQHPHHRNAHPYLSHSQAPSPHKRPWSGTERLRGSPRKQSRGGRLTDNPVHHHSAGIVGFGSPAFTASSSTKIMQNPQSETPLGSSQEPGSKVDNKGVGVKKEAFESEYLDEASATSSGVDSKLNFDIKPDPESVPNQDEYASGGNFSDNFLNDQSDPYSQPQQVSEQSEDASDTNIPMTSSIANSHSHPDSNTHHTNTGIPLEFDNSASNSAYLRQGHNPQSSSDQEAGATMEESGLDVIEIGDEDEDLQTVFGHNLKTAGVNQEAKKKKMGGQWCSAINCKNNRLTNTDMSFFRFPKDQERSRRWVVNSRRKDLLNKTAHQLFNSNVLCANHFETSQFTSSKKIRLKRQKGVPTLFDVPNPPDKIQAKRQSPKKMKGTNHF